MSIKYPDFDNAEQNILSWISNYPLNAIERPRYKAFNIELFIELSPATHG